MYKFSFIFLICFFLFLSFVFSEFFSNLGFTIPYLLGFVMLGMGMTIKIDELKSIIRRPKWIFTTIVLQYSVMPILSILIISLFNFPKEIALGFIILGSCPGGTASNVIAYICGANLSLSIFCTFASTIMAVIFTPLLIFLLADENIGINTVGLIKSTFLIVFIPVLLGLFLKLIIKNKDQNYLEFFPLFAEVAVAFIIAVIFAINSENIYKISFLVLVGVVLHNLIGLYFSFQVAKFLEFPDDVKKTVSIEVAMQNSGLGMTLALLHYTNIVALPSAIFSIWHNISAGGLVYLWKKK